MGKWKYGKYGKLDLLCLTLIILFDKIIIKKLIILKNYVLINLISNN